jgi:S1-C subfamily serine protease
MMRRTWVMLIALVLVAAVPVLAGGDHKKCKASTQECLDHMAAKMKSGGWVGVELDHDDATGALSVSKVIPGSPAEASGIQAGDVLFALNGVEINDRNEKALSKVKQDWKPGQTVTYTIRRNGADRQVAVTLAPWPADALARYIGEHMIEHAGLESEGK